MSVHTHDASASRHSHSYAEASTQQRQRALTIVVVLTVLTMVCELVAGWWTASLALTADGWHMGTHALALGGAVLAYRLSARAAVGAGYAFGGWKIEVLAAYTSALLLLGAALWLAVDALLALQSPRLIAYGDAAVVAVLGLLVNLASAWLLMRGDQAGHAAAPGHAHSHGHGHGHAHANANANATAHAHAAHGHMRGTNVSDDSGPSPAAATSRRSSDHNFNAALLHVMADAVTSVLALVALGGGAVFGLVWLDPAVALLGALVIGHWVLGMLRGTAKALVDATQDPALSADVRRLIESDGDAKVTDLHVWQVGASAWCAAVSVVADAPLPAADYRQRLAGLELLRHVTVEVHRCGVHRYDAATST